MKEILLRKSDELNGATRGYFEKLKEWLKQDNRSTYTNQEVKKVLRLPASTIKRYQLHLYLSGHVRVVHGKKHKGYEYEIVSYEEYQKLQHHIGSAMDEILHRLSSSPVAHLQNEPLKKKKIKKLDSVAH